VNVREPVGRHPVRRRHARLSPQLPLAGAQHRLDPAQLAVGDVEEVARAAGGIEHDVAAEGVLRGGELVERVARVDPLTPRLDHRRLDDLANVRLRRVVRPERPGSLAAERPLEQVAEDGRLDELPVEPAGLPEQLDLLAHEAHLGRDGEEPPSAYGAPA